MHLIPSECLCTCIKSEHNMCDLNHTMRRENKYAKSSRGGPGRASVDLCHHSLWSQLHSPPERKVQWLRRLNFPLRKQTGAAVQTRPSQQRGSTAAPGSSGLPSPPTWLAPGLALVPSPASLGQTNNHHLHSQTSSEAGRAGATSTVWRGTWPNWICFITPYNDSQTGLFQWSKIKDYKKYLPACHSEFGPKWAAPPKQMGRHLKNVLCLWGHVVFPIII